MLLKYVTCLEDKGEFVVAEIRPDPAIVREVHDELLKERQAGGRA